MHSQDIDSEQLLRELKEILGPDASGDVEPIITVVKPIRFVTLVKQETVVAGSSTTCPPGGVDLYNDSKENTDNKDAYSTKTSKQVSEKDFQDLLTRVEASLTEHQRKSELQWEARSRQLFKRIEARIVGHIRQTDANTNKNLRTLLATVEQRLQSHGRERSEKNVHLGPEDADSSATHSGAGYTPSTERLSNTPSLNTSPSTAPPVESSTAKSSTTESLSTKSLTTSAPESSPTLSLRELSEADSLVNDRQFKAWGPDAQASTLPLGQEASINPGVDHRQTSQTTEYWREQQQPVFTLYLSRFHLLLVLVAIICFLGGGIIFSQVNWGSKRTNHETQPPVDTKSTQQPTEPTSPGSEPAPKQITETIPLDSDEDGLYDPGQSGLPATSIDLCPNRPGSIQLRGCPKEQPLSQPHQLPTSQEPPPPPLHGRILDSLDLKTHDELPANLKEFDGVIRGVHFDVNRATLRPDSRTILDRAVAVLSEFPATRIEISGHTDSSGSYQHNIELSKARAETVRQYLVDHGIAASRLETRGFGPDRPLAENRTREGRFQNRRIEFKVLMGRSVDATH